MGRLRTTPTEYEYVKEFKKHKVARPTTQENLAQYLKTSIPACGDIYAGCPDMDVLFKKMGFHFQAFRRKLHPCMAVHGGGSGIHPKSPLNVGIRFPIDYFCHHVILAGSPEVKNTKRVCIYDHIGCGAARLKQLTPAQQIELNLLGRGFLEESLLQRGKDFEVIPLLYCWYGEYGTEQEYDTRCEETFVIDAEVWRDVRKQYATELNELPIRLSDFPAFA